MPPTLVGLFTGLLLGIAWVVAGFGAFLGVAALGAVGCVVGRAVSGQLDLSRFVGGSGGPR